MTLPPSKRTRSASNRDDSGSEVYQLTDEGEAIVSRLTSKIDEVYRKFEAIISEKDRKIEHLETELVTMKRNLTKLEEKIDDSEAYERRDMIVLSGELPLFKTGENCTNIVQQLVKDKLNLVIDSKDISVAHRLGKKPDSQRPDRRSIIAKLCRRDLKHELLSTTKSRRPANFYINESLTPKRDTILYALRRAKKNFPSVISGCNSVEGKVFVYVKPPNADPSARNSRMSINTYEGLSDFCSKVLNKPVSCLIDRWPHH